MDVRTDPFEDASQRDERGHYDYYYSGNLITFRDGPYGFVARQYKHEPNEAHFLARLDGECRQAFESIPYEDELFRDAVAYLVKKIGVSTVQVLLPSGYAAVDLEKARLTRRCT